MSEKYDHKNTAKKALAWLILVVAAGATIGGFVKWFIEDSASFVIFIEGTAIIGCVFAVVWAVTVVFDD